MPNDSIIFSTSNEVFIKVLSGQLKRIFPTKICKLSKFNDWLLTVFEYLNSQNLTHPAGIQTHGTIIRDTINVFVRIKKKKKYLNIGERYEKNNLCLQIYSMTATKCKKPEVFKCFDC